MIATVFYLVLIFGHERTGAIVPEPFTQLKQCELTGLAWEKPAKGRTFECIKVESRLE